MAECQHTPAPSGYIQWHAWAHGMGKTHRQVKCPNCGKWAIWLPKRPGVVAIPPDSMGGCIALPRR